MAAADRGKQDASESSPNYTLSYPPVTQTPVKSWPAGCSSNHCQEYMEDKGGGNQSLSRTQTR